MDKIRQIPVGSQDPEDVLTLDAIRSLGETLLSYPPKVCLNALFNSVAKFVVLHVPMDSRSVFWEGFFKEVPELVEIMQVHRDASSDDLEGNVKNG